jgi:hypothetical protein
MASNFCRLSWEFLELTAYKKKPAEAGSDIFCFEAYLLKAVIKPLKVGVVLNEQRI